MVNFVMKKVQKLSQTSRCDRNGAKFIISEKHLTATAKNKVHFGDWDLTATNSVLLKYTQSTILKNENEYDK